MTKLEQAARQALEALDEATSYTSCESWSPSMTDDCNKAITALREALAEQTEQEPVYKALRVAEEALMYHTEQTRPIQKTDETIIYLRNLMTQGVLNMTFTLKDAIAKYPEISYWHNEFLKHNTTAKQAEQSQLADASLEPVGWYKPSDFVLYRTKPDDVFVYAPLYAAPVRTKDPCNPLQDLTDDEIWKELVAIQASSLKRSWLTFARAVIAADREKNK